MLAAYAFFPLTVLMMNETNLHTQILICLYLTILLMTSQSLAFYPLHFKFWESGSRTHQDITRDAILQTTANICKFQANQAGKDFVMVNKTLYLLKSEVILHF